MNDPVVQQFADYLRLITGGKAAAASLAPARFSAGIPHRTRLASSRGRAARRPEWSGPQWERLYVAAEPLQVG